MKVIPIALAAHYALQGKAGHQTVCACLQVTLTDATVLGFTSLSRAITIEGVTYQPNLQLSSLASTDSLAVENLELTFLPEDQVPVADLREGRWRNATFKVFEVNYVTPADGVNILAYGTVGEAQLRRGSYVIEFRGPTQPLQQTQGEVTQKTCRVRLGSARCTVDLTPFTYTGTITGATSERVFADSARSEDGAWFAAGTIEFTTGANAGFTQKVKAFTAGDGEFTTALPFAHTPEVGDEYIAIAGCRKRFEEDCIGKFDNALNFQGEPHLPGLDKLTAPDDVNTAQPETTPVLPSEDGGGVYLSAGDGGP